MLNKSGGLNDDEWRLMQTHPWLGVLTLFKMRAYGEIPYRQIVIAHEHHMKTDLTGYPKALRPREQGIFSRIVAVADGYDAATTRRSYQTVPIQPDQVLREMWENPRRGYDPDPGQGADQPDRRSIRWAPASFSIRFEVAVVSAPNPDGGHAQPAAGPDRASTQWRRRASAGADREPGANRMPSGAFLRSIVKVTNPDRYGIVVGDYFV